jgi:tetratricopeptide (TPR) repeat protein
MLGREPTPMIPKRILDCGEELLALGHRKHFREYSAGQTNQMNQSRNKMHRAARSGFFIFALVFYASLFSSAIRAQSPPPPPPTPPAAGESSSKNADDTVPVPPKTDSEKDLAALPAMDRLAAVKDIEIGTYYLNKGNVDAAIDRLHDAAVSYPTYAEPWRLMGIAYEKKGMLGEAIKADQEYLRLYPHAQIRKKLEAHIENLQKKQQREAEKHPAK